MAAAVAVFTVIAVNDYLRLRRHLDADFLAKATVVARTLDAGMAARPDFGDKDEIFGLIQKTIWLNPELLRVSVDLLVGGILTTVVSSDSAHLGERATDVSLRAYREDALIHAYRAEGEARQLVVTSPIHVARRQVGAFQLVFTMEDVDRKVVSTFAMDLIFFAVTVIALSLALFVAIRVTIIGRLEILRDRVAAFGREGRLPPPQDPKQDEIGDLSRSFQQMAVDLSETQEKLKQSQRLEAVGQLTGGVAHDFNNLLAVIAGNMEIIADKKWAGIDESVDSVIKATRRGAELTQHLLAFARQQPLKSESLDLAALLGGLPDLLVRVLGESIAIETELQDGLWPALADSGQLEHALLNLAINARDAMPTGGRLTISCANIAASEVGTAGDGDEQPVDQVAIAVSDTGTGMPEAVAARAFEPFFTTKEVGQGSGLGLSMVYGFAKQSGGAVAIESLEGIGTTVRLFLPRAVFGPEPGAPAPGPAAPNGQGQTVLLVEDDAAVRAVVRRMLKYLGYRVVDVSDVAGAERALSQEAVDVVLSDVILPGGMSGAAYVDELRERRPDLGLILMSGYPEQLPGGAIDAWPTVVILHKPFSRDELAEVLRGVLEETQEA